MTGPDYPPDSPPLTAQAVKSAFELPWGAQLPGRRRVRAHRPLVVGQRADPAGRGEHGRRARRWRRAHAARAEPAGTRGCAGSCRGGRGRARYELLARATDRTGATQPETVPFNDGGYQFWAVARHPVMVA